MAGRKRKYPNENPEERMVRLREYQRNYQRENYRKKKAEYEKFMQEKYNIKGENK
ncbi:MAG: hypothetical protein SA378_05285 [Sedimentibacter sp.]|uniref:hypothetical protein n=1 Tax=Sedimentibacter sp. TaxID=1960295 RepID=UPI0029810A56|nr:hypothetical protein [Sedimentibacter sp.]MDW5299535.1 hypothetical protein [Sedimentibacter sp.]